MEKDIIKQINKLKLEIIKNIILGKDTSELKNSINEKLEKLRNLEIELLKKEFNTLDIKYSQKKALQ